MIVVDTSVWIEQLAKGIPGFADIVESDEVLMHPFVVGEVACGVLKERAEVLGLMQDLRQPVVATHEEILKLIEERRLMGRGIGYVDMHLIGATLLTDIARLWTRDRRLKRVAADLGIAYSPPHAE